MIATLLNPPRTYVGRCAKCGTATEREIACEAPGGLTVVCEATACKHAMSTVVLAYDPDTAEKFAGNCPVCGRMLHALADVDERSSVRVICQTDHAPTYVALTAQNR